MEQIVNKRLGGSPSVYVRLPPELAADLETAASEADLSRAGWVRQQIARALPTRVDISFPPSPPRRPATIAPADLAEVSRLTAAVARTGGALVQLAKVFRRGGHVAYSDAEAALADLRTVQSDLVSLVAELSHRQAGP